MSIGADEKGQVISSILDELRESSSVSVLFSQAVAEKLGLNSTDVECLNLISAGVPITAGQLAEQTGLTTGAITGVIDRLEKGGFVRRESDPGDRRKVVLRPLPERQAEVSQLFEAMQEAMQAICARYDRQQLNLIHNFLIASNEAVQEQIVHMRGITPLPKAVQRPDQPDHARFTARLDAQEGQLVFLNGASHLTIHSGGAADELYHAYFEHPVPRVQVRGGTVSFFYKGPSFLQWREKQAEVLLNNSIPWRVEFRGGASQVEVDLRQLRIEGVELSGGSNEITLRLPHPAGLVRVRFIGGSNKVQIYRPAGVAMRAHIAPAPKDSIIDEQRLDPGRETHFETSNFKRAANRYEISVIGGANRLVIGER